MAVKLELYRIFKEVAEEQSISAAAKNLYISQSAVSQSIKQLEDQLKVRLFIRGPRGVTLSGEGRLLYDYVRSAMSLLQNGEDKIAQARELLMGELVIGASDTVTKCYLLPYLQAFHQDYPAIRIKIMNGTSHEVLDMLHSGQVDIAFASTPEDASSLQLRHCLDTHNIFVASKEYSCNFERIYTLGELARFPLILLERKSSVRRFMERFFVQNGISLKPEIELCSHELLVYLAQIGLGVACVTKEFVEPALASGSIREVRTAPTIPSRSLSVCTLRDVAPTPAANQFLKFLSQPEG